MVLIENSQILNAGNDAEPAYAMAIEATELPQVQLKDNTFSENRLNRVLIIEGTVASHATLRPQTELEGYELYGQLTVSTGITLTVEPGTTMMGREQSTFPDDDHIQVVGHLHALGTADKPITFTSAWDTDGNQWGGIYFNGGSGHLNHVTVRYGGREFYTISPHANIYIRDVRPDGEVLIENSQIQSAGTVDSAAYGIVIEATELPQVRLLNNTFSGNWPNRIQISEGTVASDATLLPQASGLEGYEVYGRLTVGAEATLTVEPGTTVMGREQSIFPQDDHIQVVGHLQAVGTANNPIIFTSAWDTESNQWGGLYFNGGSGHLKHVTVRYGGREFYTISPRANIYVRNVTDGQQVLIENSQISQSGGDGLHVYNGQVKVHLRLRHLPRQPG